MLSTICSAMCAELRHCQRWVTNRERQRVPQWRTRDGKTSLSVSCRSWSRYRQIATCCRSEMTSASGGRNRVAHHCKVPSGAVLWRHLKISRQRSCTSSAAEWAASAVDLGCRWWCGRISVCAVSVEPLRSAVVGYELHAHRRWHCYNNQYDWWQTHVRVTWRRLQLVIGEQSWVFSCRRW